MAQLEAVYRGRRRRQDLVSGRRVNRPLPGYTAVGLNRCERWIFLSEFGLAASLDPRVRWRSAGGVAPGQGKPVRTPIASPKPLPGPATGMPMLPATGRLARETIPGGVDRASRSRKGYWRMSQN